VGGKKHLQDAKDCLGESNIDQFLPFNQIWGMVMAASKRNASFIPYEGVLEQSMPSTTEGQSMLSLYFQF